MTLLKTIFTLGLLIYSINSNANPQEALEKFTSNAMAKDDCDDQVIGRYLTEEKVPESYTFKHKGPYSDEPETYTIYIFECMNGYNDFATIYLYDETNDYTSRMLFAEPTYENQNTEDELSTDVKVTGFKAKDYLINVEFDPSSKTLRSMDLFRGMGDAFSSGEWTFNGNDFSLTHFEVDESYDEVQNPITILDIN